MIGSGDVFGAGKRIVLKRRRRRNHVAQMLGGRRVRVDGVVGNMGVVGDWRGQERWRLVWLAFVLSVFHRMFHEVLRALLFCIMRKI